MSTIILKNGNRYTKFLSGRLSKMCKIETCTQVSCGEYCRKHKVQDIKENEKKCTRCFNVKEKNDFIIDGVEFMECNICHEKSNKSGLKRHQKRREFLLQIKINMGGKCIDCETTDLEILELDHVNGIKIKEVRKIYNYKEMLEEAKKCELRCSNCHSKKTVNMYERYETTDNTILNSRAKRDAARDFVDYYKLNSDGCETCGHYDPDFLQTLQFDHIDVETKENCIARLVSLGKSIDIIKTEIDKCSLLCANCHRKKTLRQFNCPIVDMIANLSIEN